VCVCVCVCVRPKVHSAKDFPSAFAYARRMSQAADLHVIKFKTCTMYVSQTSPVGMSPRAVSMRPP
jgi:hypothetical protein